MLKFTKSANKTRLPKTNIAYVVVCAFMLLSNPLHARPNYCNQSLEQQGINQATYMSLVNSSYEYYSCFSEGLAVVRYDKKYGYVNRQLNEVIELQYESATIFSDGLAVVSVLVNDKNSLLPWKKVKKYGFIDKNNQWILPPIYDYARPFSFERAVVGQKIDGNMKYGFIDSKGVLVIPYRYDDASLFLRNPVHGYRNEQNTIIEARVSKIDNGKKRYFLINRAGELTVPVGSEDNTLYFSAGLAKITVDGKHGFVNRDGKFVIPAIYQNAYSFTGEGQPAAVRDQKTGKWGFIDVTGKQVLPFVYYHAMPFADGKANITEADGHTRYAINIQGKKVD